MTMYELTAPSTPHCFGEPMIIDDEFTAPSSPCCQQPTPAPLCQGRRFNFGTHYDFQGTNNRFQTPPRRYIRARRNPMWEYSMKGVQYEHLANEHTDPLSRMMEGIEYEVKHTVKRHYSQMRQEEQMQACWTEGRLFERTTRCLKRFKTN